MKVSAVHLRWYKSFNINYLGYDDRQPDILSRPWNSLGATSPSAFRFIEIPLHPSITTIVGGNESGKSHLLSALSKVLSGVGIPESDDSRSPFNVTDLCHYASVRDKNARNWPNIGATFEDLEQDELAALVAASKAAQPKEECKDVTLILDHGDDHVGLLFFGRNDPGIRLTADSLAAVRNVLPDVEFIQSNVPLASELPIDDLLANGNETAADYVEFELAQNAAKFISQLTVAADKKLTDDHIDQLNKWQQALKPKPRQPRSRDETPLESQLFEDVLGIDGTAIELLASIKRKDRGFAEGLVATWNQELDKTLNLRRFWQQDDHFSLSLNFKGGWFYFEIRDKTGSVYTFRERSSGLRFFLSYYIQAKSIESRYRGKQCIILMDEPDSFLSISGQKNLLAVFESLVSPSEGNKHLQMVYTTHSPFLINPNYPHRIRLVQKGESEEGSQHINESRLRRYEPVRSALGIDCAQTLFMGAANILLEGAADQLLIVELIRIFTRIRKKAPTLDLSQVVVVSADSAPSIEKVLGASKWVDERIPATVVLLDSDSEGEKQRKRITGQAKNLPLLIEERFVVLVGEAIDVSSKQTIASIEDLVPAKAFGEAVDEYLARWYPDQYAKKKEEIKTRTTSEEFGVNGNAADTQALFDDCVFETKRDYDKLGVIQVAIEIVEREAKSDSQNSVVLDVETRLEALLDCLRKKIEQSVQESQSESARQAIIRLSDDFFKRFKSSAGAFEIELHLERINREVDLASEDSETLSGILKILLDEIRESRSQGPSLIEGPSWHRWSSLIYAIKKNPFSPEINAEEGKAEPVHLWRSSGKEEQKASDEFKE